MTAKEFAKRNWSDGDGAKDIEYDPAEFLANSAKIPPGAQAALDGNEDAWAKASLPPKGDYPLVLFVDKAKPVKTRAGEDYCKVSIEGRMISEDPDVNTMPVTATLSTWIPRGKHISKAAGVAMKLGVKMPERPVSHYEQACLLISAILHKEPKIWVHIDWQARYQESDGTWRTVFSTQDQFPKNEDGSYRNTAHITRRDGTPIEVSAKLTIVEWYGKDKPTHGEKVAAQKPNSGGSGLDKSAPVLQIALDDE
jgi:hypothetical protein